MEKEKDYFTGSTKDVVGDIITHQSMRKFKRGIAQRRAELDRRSAAHLQFEKDGDGKPKIIYHDKEAFRKPIARKQVDRAHRPFNPDKYELDANNGGGSKKT